jgi:sulfur-carrier protein adenylyltransferase/sulfurtransferase
MTTFKTGADLINEAKSRIAEVSPTEAQTMRDANTVYLDVREPNEWNLGHIPSALHIPRGQLEGKVESMIGRNTRVIIYCASGNRSALAADTMQQMGYSNVMSLRDGFKGWASAGGDIED